MRGRSNRYYAFRNTGRLGALKRFKVLFAFLTVFSILVLGVGGMIFGAWFFVNLITLFLRVDRFARLLDIAFYTMISGVGAFVASLILKIVIERVYFRAEKRELKRNPDGSKKYLAVMRVNFRADLVNMGLWLVVILTVGVGGAIDFQSTASIVAIAVTILVVFIVGRIIFGRMYKKVATEIDQIKEERRGNK